MHGILLKLLSVLFLLTLTYFTGRIVEKNHFKEIQQREIALIKKPIITFGAKKWSTKRPIKDIRLVTGEVVIAGEGGEAGGHPAAPKAPCRPGVGGL